MKNLLGIDFGLSKVGLAKGEGILSMPLMVLKNKNTEILIKKLLEVIEKNNIEKIIVGISEGQMGENSKKFAQRLKKETRIPVKLFDETLSTQDAQKMAIEAGIKRSKRKALEDAWAASVMLQNYIDIYCNL